MGYTTEFTGSLKFNKPIKPELKNYINTFSETRRMKRDVAKIKEIYSDWHKHCFNGKLGIDGEYFAYDDGEFGQYHDDSIIDYNKPAKTQPSLWCQWVIDDNDELVWDGGEKFYHYTEWLSYLITNFFKPEGYVLNGQFDWQGEYDDDTGKIIVKDNNISIE